MAIWHNGTYGEVPKMKKTTIYLEDQELEMLKQKAYILNTSIAEIIRRSIKALCTPTVDEEKALKLLAKIRGNASGRITDKEVLKIQREVRNEKKTKSRS
jgi:hypothetical protein